MKISLLVTVLLLSAAAQAQYYYKDIIGTKETADLIKAYKANKVTRVLLTSFDETNTKTDEFYVEQQFSSNDGILKTITRSGVTNESVLTSYVDASGNVIRTIDSSELLKTITDYTYNSGGQLLSISSTSTDTRLNASQKEDHIWQYKDGRINRMLRIKNKIDTTYVDFVLDENGNVIEENAVRRGKKLEPVQYFYDASNRLTDVVRFNQKARRLLPEYMFEYSASNQVIQKITVPEMNSNYMIWRYQYNAQGLKTKEAVYNKEDKRKQLGRVEYQYSFGS
jgi:hypothetical protein